MKFRCSCNLKLQRMKLFRKSKFPMTALKHAGEILRSHVVLYAAAIRDTFLLNALYRLTSYSYISAEHVRTGNEYSHWDGQPPYYRNTNSRPSWKTVTTSTLTDQAATYLLLFHSTRAKINFLPEKDRVTLFRHLYLLTII